VAANFVTDAVDDALARVVQRLAVIANAAAGTPLFFDRLTFLASRGSHRGAWDRNAFQRETTTLVRLVDNLLARATLWHHWFLAQPLPAFADRTITLIHVVFQLLAHGLAGWWSLS